MLAVLAVSGAAAGMLTLQRQQRLSEKLVRLHVRANSDSVADQRLKLQVRDAVLAQVQQKLSDCQSREAALQCLSRSLPSLAQTAADTLRQSGCGYGVSVSLQKECFPTREYDTFSLPAGSYTALRIDIGQAAGQNWWCVVFPTLCQSATTEGMAEAAAAAGFSADDLELMTSETPKIKIRFRLLEFFTNLFSAS